MGKIDDPRAEFVRFLLDSLRDDTFVRLVLSGPRPVPGSAEKILGKLVNLKDGPRLSLTFRHATKDITKNLHLTDVEPWLREQLDGHFRSALLSTTKRDYQLFAPSLDAIAKLIVHKPLTREAPSRTHDESRRKALDHAAQDWLHGLSITNADGHVRPTMASKYAQIDRYLEIFSHLAKDCGWPLPATAPPLVIADMGCGKGYLTFGLWHLFTRLWKRPVDIIGIELRDELATASQALANKIGARGLQFRTGAIETSSFLNLDALIALHACNTATDAAVLRGVETRAKLILVAPCCHQEIRPQLGPPAPLAPVLRHGLMAERLAEWATDGLRSLFLEWAGYDTKLIEFVSTEHTPKNLMIAATLQGPPYKSSAARRRIEEFKTFLGIKHHALDPLLQHESNDD